MFSKKQSQRAFTIVELLVVIVVIAVLAVITIVAYNGIQNRATVSLLTAKLSMTAKALEADRAVNTYTQARSQRPITKRELPPTRELR